MISFFNKVIHRIIRDIHFWTPHTVECRDIKFKMSFIELGSTLDKSLHRYGNYEPWLSSTLMEELNQDDIVCDIGAYRGYYSLLLHQIVFSPKNIYTFEPDPTNSRYLTKNISKTTLIKKLVSDKDDNENISLNNLFIDNLELAPPTALKIDVDGGEIKLIKGSVKFIENHHPKIFMEVHPIQIQQFEANGIETMFDILFEHYQIMYMKNHWGRAKGYDDWNGKGTHEWEPIQRDELVAYCHEIINDNIGRRASIYNNAILPRGFAIYCS
jgi:hypothetical protein